MIMENTSNEIRWCIYEKEYLEPHAALQLIAPAFRLAPGLGSLGA